MLKMVWCGHPQLVGRDGPGAPRRNPQLGGGSGGSMEALLGLNNVVPAMSRPAASPAARARRKPPRRAATDTKRKIEDGEAAEYERTSDEDYDSLLESGRGALSVAPLSRMLPSWVEHTGRPGKPMLVSGSRRGRSPGVHSTGCFALQEAPGWRPAPCVQRAASTCPDGKQSARWPRPSRRCPC
jgi:hypothetical protein